MTRKPRFKFRLIALCAAGALLAVPAPARPAGDPARAALLAAAPTCQIVADVSGSSPALDQRFMDSIAPVIAARIRELPVGTLVTLTTVGDATQPASLARLQIQARGNTAAEVARKLERALRAFPAQRQGKEQGRSDLVGGFAAAAAYLNRATDTNLLVMVSDLVEYSQLADCSRARRCALPVKPSFDLKGAQVVVYGVGQGLPSDRAMQLTEDWRAFLTRAHATAIDLRRF